MTNIQLLFLDATIYMIGTILLSILFILCFVILFFYAQRNYKLTKTVRSIRQQYVEILEVTRSGIWEWKKSTNKISFDYTLKQLLNIKNFPSELTFTEWITLIDPVFGDKFVDAINDVEHGLSPAIIFEFNLTNQYHKERSFRCYGKVIEKDKQGNPAWMVGIITDITNEKNAIKKVDYMNYMLRNVIENNNGGVAIYDTNMNYLYVSDLFKKQFHITDDIIGKNHYELFPDIPEKFKDAHKRSLKGEILGENRDTFIRSMGETHYTSWSTRPWYDQNGVIGGIISYVQVITDQVEKEMQLDYVTKRDALTGVFNRSFFIEEFARLDHEDSYPIGVILLDLNGLKLINDAYGFEHGDHVLMLVSKALLEFSKDIGDLFRMGGDEFAFLTVNTNEKRIKSYIRLIHERISELKYLNITLNFSIGYAIKNDHQVATDEVFKQAESEMYKRKILDSTSLRNNAIKGIIQTLNDKYQIEKEHSERVQKFCLWMGEALNLDKEDLNELSIAALLHDIGKISIPDSILDKPGKLTDEEYEIMKTHTEKGYQILRAADGYSDLAKYALTHHERYDGDGYPQKLSGEDIPLFSRIISICDSYEAMTADRPYRKAQSRDYAISELNKYSGKQFDAKLVKVFIEEVIPKEDLKKN